MRNVKRISLSRKEKGHNQKRKNYESENFTCKGKHTVKVVGQPVVKLVERLEEKSCKIIFMCIKQLRNTQNKNMYDFKNIKHGHEE